MRFFVVSPEELKSDLVMLNANEAAHALRVLRLSVGQEVWLVDGAGHQARATIERTNPMLCRVQERPPWQAPLPRLVFGLGVSKNPAMDLMAQKLTELMLDEVRPFAAIRSVSEGQKHQRWERIALQTLKQCRCPRTPRYWPLDSLQNVLKAAPPDALKLLAWEEEQSRLLCSLLERPRPGEIWALIGPEGGFSQEEVELAKAHGFVACQLSKSVLRAETAAIALASVLRCQWPG